MRALEFDLEAGPSTEALDLAAQPPAGPGPLTLELLGEPRVRRRKRLVIAAALAIAAGIGLGVVLLRGEAESAPANVQLAPLATSGTPPAASPAPATATVSLRNVPANARVTLDGQLQSGDSFEVPNDGRTRTIEVVAPGKRPWRKSHPSKGNAVYDVWLVDEPTAPARKTATAGKASTKSTARQTSVKPASSTATRPSHTAPAPARPRKKAPSALRKLDF